MTIFCQFPVAINDLQHLGNNLDLTNWTRGTYVLEKNPQGLYNQRLQNSRLIGRNPGMERNNLEMTIGGWLFIRLYLAGVRSLLTATDTEDVAMHQDRRERSKHVLEVRGRNYQ